MKRLKFLFSVRPAYLTLGTIFVVVPLFLSGVPILDLLELKTYDLRLRSRGQAQPAPAIVMALIDEKSLDTEGRWPWPRSKIATLVDILSRERASVIGFDIGFLEPESGQQVDNLALSQSPLTAFINERKQQVDNDLILASAIRRSSTPVVLGYFFHMHADDLDDRLEPSEIDQQLKRIRASKYPFIMHQEPDSDVVPGFRAYAPETNLEMFTEAAASSGYFSLRSDADGIVRRLPLVIQGGEDFFPPLAVLCAWHYLGKPQLTVQVGRYSVDGIKMGSRFIPTDEHGQLLINYLGPPKTFPHVSISHILAGTFPQGTFIGKIVLVGATATGTYDMRSTPVSPVYPGVEIHATAIDNILTQNFIARSEWSKIYDLCAIIILAGLIGVILPRTSALTGLVCAAGLFALYIVIAGWLFVQAGVWLNLVYPLLALSMTYTSLTVYRRVKEE